MFQFKAKGQLRSYCQIYILCQDRVPRPLQPTGHGLRTPDEEIAFTARPKIKSQSQIYRHGQSIFCLPHRPKISGFFELCLHWVSVVRESNLVPVAFLCHPLPKPPREQMVYALAKMHSGFVRAGYMYHIKYLHFFLIILSHNISLCLSGSDQAKEQSCTARLYFFLPWLLMKLLVTQNVYC